MPVTSIDLTMLPSTTVELDEAVEGEVGAARDRRARGARRRAERLRQLRHPRGRPRVGLHVMDRMDLDRALDFVREHHHAVMPTFRRDGSPQMSPIACGVDADGLVVVSTRETALKTKNLRRDPRVSRVRAVSDGFFGDWIQVDGTRRGGVVARRDGAPGRVLPLAAAASTPTGTTTAPRWCATSASSCASPPSAPVRTAPVDASPPPSSPPAADRASAVTRRSRCSSGGGDRLSRGRSTPRWRPGSRPSWSSPATAPTTSGPPSPPTAPRGVDGSGRQPGVEEGIASSLRTVLRS